MFRFWLSGFIAERFGETFPYGTLVVNLVGSLIIGFVAARLGHLSDAFLALGLKQFIVEGVCGGLTTFSSFSLQNWNLIRVADGVAHLQTSLYRRSCV